MLPHAYELPAAVLLVLVGALTCFAGYKLFRIVLTIWGLGDIGARSAGFGRQRDLTLRRAGQFYQDRCLVAKQGNAWVGGPTAQAASESAATPSARRAQRTIHD